MEIKNDDKKKLNTIYTVVLKLFVVLVHVNHVHDYNHIFRI